MILGSIIEPFVVESFLGRLEGLAAEPVAATGGTVSDALRDVERAEADLAAYRDDTRISNVLGAERFLAGLEARVQVVDDKNRALAEARAAAGSPAMPPAAELRKLWPELDTCERQQLLRAGIDAVMLRAVGRANRPVAERALLLWHGEAPADFPGRGRRHVPLLPFRWPDGPGEAWMAVA